MKRFFHSTPNLLRSVDVSSILGSSSIRRLRKSFDIEFDGGDASAQNYPLQKPVADLKVEFVSGDGKGICVKDGRVFVAPLVLPGEIVTLKPYANISTVSLCDLVRVQQSSPDRVDPKCNKFTKCSSCSYQHWSYPKQLEHKHQVIKSLFTDMVEQGLLDESIIKPFQESPRQYGVRNKLTPHHPQIKANSKLEAVGFLERGRQKTVIDVDYCPIATDAVNEGLRRIRSGLVGSVKPVHRLGSTYLIRQSLSPQTSTQTKQPLPPFSEPPAKGEVHSRTMNLEDFIKRIKTEPNPLRSLDSFSTSKIPLGQQLKLTPTTTIQPYPPKHLHPYPVTSTKSTILDIVNGHAFRTPSDSFYQNNSHILPYLVTHISNQLTTPPHLKTDILIDAYCGTGLFALTQSHHFKTVLGIELDPTSITWARQNAIDNGIENTRFLAGDVSALFQNVPVLVAQTDPSIPRDRLGEHVSLIVDPPKTGCTPAFLEQVMRLNPRVIVYVSCNPATQVRDLLAMHGYAENGVPPPTFTGSVGGMVRGEEEAGKVNLGLEQNQVLYLGGKKIIRRRDRIEKVDVVEVQDLPAAETMFVSPESGIGKQVNMKGQVEPVTLLKVKGYKVTEVKPFDMFPQSHRTEVVVTLVREDYVDAK
ncbi:S-adenosyl-L-methionine-dependent methyltransferase [Rhizoclosmatium globosum]|uniref:S-adenosyl-L-methionine-dependent methyltransferase n=1 Tax=Rhizoclosmatium globosum TaxID=329046 RepID=A0A1Y2BPG0_9FUNG|nr:S-adenosyl-L-methionine-dependent methyltransferase [Rhizoclosmatium globosum]|eukprot:ORY36640.1 S-adenosyl-L-methionine-dependent methyltransferase [Rhizoclosmatium globosum]